MVDETKKVHTKEARRIVNNKIPALNEPSKVYFEAKRHF
jgi:hypothetical protein